MKFKCFITIWISTFSALPAIAQMDCINGATVGAPKLAVPMKSNEFRHSSNSGGLHCSATLSKAEEELLKSGKLPPAHKMCHIINGIGIDMNRTDIEKIMGKPQKILPQGAGQAEVYTVTNNTEIVAYYVVSYIKDVVNAVQATMTSTKWDELPIAFSSIPLGQNAQRALDVLGTPSKKCTGKNIFGELWSYAPYPITIEIMNGKIFSIKLEIPK
jgi:hypothetical protein